MFNFLRSKPFLINLAVAILFAILVVWGIFKYINSYTLHNETISVPTLEGLTIDEVESILSEKKLRYLILDSIFVSEADKGVVLEQNPIPNELVKENRTIYITTSKVIAPKKQIPSNIIGDASRRIAIAKLESIGFKIGKLNYIPSKDNDVVLKMEINGKPIKNGDWIFKNSTIDLTLGGGLSGNKIMVPYLIGLTVEEASSKLLESSLNAGFSDYENCKCETKDDSLNAKIYRQSPIRSQSVIINMGSSVDLYYTCDTNLINFNPPVIDTTEINLIDAE